MEEVEGARRRRSERRSIAGVERVRFTKVVAAAVALSAQGPGANPPKK
jgi:hypothetical protein